jgi:hypothetical protein
MQIKVLDKIIGMQMDQKADWSILLSSAAYIRQILHIWSEPEHSIEFAYSY